MPAGVHPHALAEDRSNVPFAAFSTWWTLQGRCRGLSEHFVNGGQTKPCTVVPKQLGMNAAGAEVACGSELQNAILNRRRPLKLGTEFRAPAACQEPLDAISLVPSQPKPKGRS